APGRYAPLNRSLDRAPALPNAGAASLHVAFRYPIAGPTVIGAERYAMAATVVGAIDQDTAHAHLAHVAKGDLLRPLLSSKWGTSGRSRILQPRGAKSSHGKRSGILYESHL